MRPTSLLPPKPALFERLPVNLDDITHDEVMHAGAKLRRKRAAGLDDVPPEFWKTITQRGSPALSWATEFCMACWRQKSVPDVWHDARIACIFKKGDASYCGNYRPISLLPIGYKLFATILLQRLRHSGAEHRLWPTQFGFRTSRSTEDTIFIARRAIEEAWEQKVGSAILLALDWAKAFDPISPDALNDALRRFDVPSPFIDMASSIYKDRRFLVKDVGVTSDWYKQEFRICQGCPLSPFLFVMVMTILLQDAHDSFSSEHGKPFSPPFCVNDLVYADDTLLIGVDAKSIESLMWTK